MSFNEVKSSVFFNKILLATDFSPSANIATEYAIGLSRRFSSTLELVTTIDLSIAVPCLDGLSGPALIALRRSAEEGLERWTQAVAGLNAQKKTVEGFLASSEILNEADDFHADLVVMGTTSKHGLKKFLLGSTAEDVIRNAKCPVLTIGPHVPEPRQNTLVFKSILFATDSSEPASISAQYAFGIADEFEANLCICHVIDEKDHRGASVGEARSIFAENTPHSGNVMCLERRGRVDEEILRIAKDVGADLIVLGAQRASSWITLITNGVTPAVLTDAECPVMTVSSEVLHSHSHSKEAEAHQL